MSAKIYSVPSEVPVPKMDFSNFDHAKWKADEKKFKTKLSDWCKRRKATQDNRYIGGVIRLPVADGQAEYMVASLRPLELIHLPLGDAYEAQDVDLMTAKRVKEKIDADKRLQAFFNREPKEADVQEAIDRLGIEATKMSNAEIKEKCYPKQSWTCSHFHVRWRGITYLIPRFNHETDNHVVFKYLVNKCKATLID